MKRKQQVAKRETTIMECFKGFFTEKLANNLSRKTLDNYEKTIYSFLKELEVEDIPVKEVNEDLWYRWIGRMRNRDLSISSINHYIRDVRVFFHWCMDRDYIEEFKMKELKQQEELPKDFSDDKLTTLLERPRDEDGFSIWRSWAITVWILATGNRTETVRNIKVDDINFKSKEITLTTTKNNKAQIIPLTPALERDIKYYMDQWDLREYLFPDKNGEQASYNALRIGFMRFCESRGLDQHNLHGLRHSFARSWAESDGNVFKLQTALGHSSITMTKRYVRLYGTDMRDSYQEHSTLEKLTKGVRKSGDPIRKKR